MHSSVLLRVSDPIYKVSAFAHVRILPSGLATVNCQTFVPSPSAAEGAEMCSVSADVQKRATRVLNSGSDAIIQSTTGSGKTLSFVLPLLGSAIRYPPEANPAEFPVRIYSEKSTSADSTLYRVLRCQVSFSHKVLENQEDRG